MTTISVASGKGGAGKTSIATALSVAIAAMPGESCIFADCDVDAANGMIALGARVTERFPYFAGPGFSIATEACLGCGRCASACRFKAIHRTADGSLYAIAPELCERCGACLDHCPAGAVRTYEKQAGTFSIAETAHGPRLVFAELEPGEDTSGKLVRVVRERAEQESCEHGIIVIDAAPGIGCPVIASLSGADLVIIVIEASVSGIRDAIRLADLAISMKRKAIAIINKTGLSPAMDSSARIMLAEKGIPLAAEIMFDPALRVVGESGSAWISALKIPDGQVASAIGAIKTAALEIHHGQSGKI